MQLRPGRNWKGLRRDVEYSVHLHSSHPAHLCNRATCLHLFAYSCRCVACSWARMQILTSAAWQERAVAVCSRQRGCKRPHQFSVAEVLGEQDCLQVQRLQHPLRILKQKIVASLSAGKLLADRQTPGSKGPLTSSLCASWPCTKEPATRDANTMPHRVVRAMGGARWPAALLFLRTVP